MWNELKHQATLNDFYWLSFFYNMGVETVMYSAALFAKQQIFPNTGNKKLTLPTEKTDYHDFNYSNVRLVAPIYCQFFKKIWQPKSVIDWRVICWLAFAIAAYFSVTPEIAFL